MIAIDTNLLVYLLLDGPLTKHAERVRAKEKAWFAPPLLPPEFLNVLARYVRHGEITRDEAARFYRRGLAKVKISNSMPDPISILRMAEQSGCSTYDLQYVWLASELGVPLVTSDKEVLDAFPETAVSLTEFRV